MRDPQKKRKRHGHTFYQYEAESRHFQLKPLFKFLTLTATSSSSRNPTIFYHIRGLKLPFKSVFLIHDNVIRDRLLCLTVLVCDSARWSNVDRTFERSFALSDRVFTGKMFSHRLCSDEQCPKRG